MEYIERSMSMWFRPLPAKSPLERNNRSPSIVPPGKRKPKPKNSHLPNRTARTTEFHHKTLLQCSNTVRPLTAPPPESSQPPGGYNEGNNQQDAADVDNSSKLHILDRVVGNLQTLLSEMRNYTVFEQHRGDNNVVEKIERIDLSTKTAVDEKAKKNINNNNNPTLRFIKKKRNSAKQYFKHVSKLGSLRRTNDKDEESKKNLDNNEKNDLLFEQTPLYEARYGRQATKNLCAAPPVPARTLSSSPTLTTDNRLSAMSVCRFPKSESLWRPVVLREHRKKCQNRLTELEEEARMLKYAIYSKCS